MGPSRSVNPCPALWPSPCSPPVSRRAAVQHRHRRPAPRPRRGGLGRPVRRVVARRLARLRPRRRAGRLGGRGRDDRAHARHRRRRRPGRAGHLRRLRARGRVEAGRVRQRGRVLPGPGGRRPRADLADGPRNADPRRHLPPGRPVPQPPRRRALRPLHAHRRPSGRPGDWNTSRIVARGARIEHHLNGTRVVVAEQGSADWDCARGRQQVPRRRRLPRLRHPAVRDHRAPGPRRPAVGPRRSASAPSNPRPHERDQGRS